MKPAQVLDKSLILLCRRGCCAGCRMRLDINEIQQKRDLSWPIHSSAGFAEKCPSKQPGNRGRLRIFRWPCQPLRQG